MALKKVTYKDNQTVITAQNMNDMQDAIIKLEKEVENFNGSEATGISVELTKALRTYFTNMQTLLQQIAYITENNIGNTLIENSKNIIKVLVGEVAEIVPATGITLDKTTLSFTDSSAQTLAATVTPSNTTDLVEWRSSDTRVATVLEGVVTPISNGSATITATAGSVSASCEVTVNVEEFITLSSISAIYTGGTVAAGTELTDLSGITVTATYSDGSSANVTDYTLSGEIAAGENTITVTYQGITTTFEVTGEVTMEPVYQLAEATTFDGATSIDTGYMLTDEDRDWSVVTEFSASAKTSFVWDSSHNASGGVLIKCPNGYHWRALAVTNYAPIGHATVSNLKVIMTHTKGAGTIEVHCIPDENGTKKEFTSTSVQIPGGITDGNYITDNTVRLGSDYTGAANYFTGTIHTFEIYERVLTSEEINTFMGV